MICFQLDQWLKNPCPKCKAKAGDKCTHATHGRFTKWPHKERSVAHEDKLVVLR